MFVEVLGPLGGYIFPVVLIVIALKGFFTVSQQSAAIIERFGKFVRIAHPGLNFKIPLIEKVQGYVNLRLVQLDVEVETKTNDDVFVAITASVQFRVLPSKVYESFYTLENAEEQIQAYVFDVVRAHVPNIKLDDVFSKKDEIADSVRSELKEVMNDFGYDIIKALVTDIRPDARVKAAMNEINESQRLRVAAMERGEAEKILKVKQAEGEAASKILQGQGMAGQRKAIIDGLRDSLTHFQEEIQDINTQDVMTLILMAQYFDTLKEMGAHSQMNTILLPHSPSSLHELYNQIRTAVISANQVEGAPQQGKPKTSTPQTKG
jgi:regulator of protease activity HflC (stomatin/prohibitin superfamily)